MFNLLTAINNSVLNIANLVVKVAIVYSLESVGDYMVLESGCCLKCKRLIVNSGECYIP